MPNRTTEMINERSIHIDEMTSFEIVSLMTEEDRSINIAVKKALPQVAKVVDQIVQQWETGGRVFVVGAGTSGRLGILDAVELPPTFSIDANRWQGFIAGGREAMWSPLEEYEDDENAITRTLAENELSEKDIVLGVSASGSTPYVLAALSYGQQVRATTVAISCNLNAVASTLSDFWIEVDTGPEVIKGSTRLKAGTAQKMILNMISTATMIKLGKVYQNQMVDMQLINKKLVKRAADILSETVGISAEEAQELMKKSNNQLKTAIFMGLTESGIDIANACLKQTNGKLKDAIKLYAKKEES